MARIVTAIKTKQFTFIVKKSPCFCHGWIIHQKCAIKRSEYASAVNLFDLLLGLQTTTFQSALRSKITPIFHSKGTLPKGTRTERVRFGTYSKHTHRDFGLFKWGVLVWQNDCNLRINAFVTPLKNQRKSSRLLWKNHIVKLKQFLLS